MSKYLEQFPEEYRRFVRSRFSQAYVFAEQSYEFDTGDEIDVAVGPKTMKARVIDGCETLMPFVDDDKKKVLEQILSTVDESDEFLREVKDQVDSVWAKAREYQQANPRKERKKADPPSEKQLKYLKSLGCLETPKTKAEATRLIDKYKK